MGTKEFNSSTENMIPSEKFENPLKMTVSPPIMNPYIHWPELVFGPVIGSVTTKAQPKRKEPDRRVKNGDGIAACPDRFNNVLKTIPPKRQETASFQGAAFL